MQLVSPLRRHIGRLEIIAFVTGFVLMAFELVASRLLAPTIGTSIYVWTSVIGVMIGALAIGYAAGGWLADQRAEPMDITWLLLGATGTVTITCILCRPITANIAASLRDVRLQGVVASVVLFMPTTFLLGMCAPYLTKLRVRSTATTGQSVAGLSAANSLGGITGTFCAGFLLFAWIGSRETLVILACLLAACSWLILPARIWRQRLQVSAVLAAICALQLPWLAGLHSGTVDIDTPTAHYQIVSALFGGRPIRAFITGPGGLQSGVYTNGSPDLVFPYTQKLAAIAAAAPHAHHVLMLGGGALTLPAYLARSHPDMDVDVVEIDPQLQSIASRYFNYKPTSNIHFISQDARTYLAHTTTRYDLILVDVYNDASVPFALTTQEYTAALRHILHSDGEVAVNLIGGTDRACMPLLASLQKSYRTSFTNWRLYPLGDATASYQQNIVALYSNAPLNWANAVQGQQNLVIASGKTLTDDYAPVEPLQQSCKVS